MSVGYVLIEVELKAEGRVVEVALSVHIGEMMAEGSRKCREHKLQLSTYNTYM